MDTPTHKAVVVIPNLNGGEELLAAIQSLTQQTLQPHIILVDNASTDGSAEHAIEQYPQIELIRNKRNRGYAGGVNPGFERAIELDAEFVAPFNNDAIADKHWLELLVDFLSSHSQYGAAAPKVVSSDNQRLDSTGDFYTVWGLSYPRGRREYETRKYDDQTELFAAPGSASLYRVKALKQVGLLDQDFFAYYEDVDLSFRLQLASWKVAFVPRSTVRHHIGMTGGRIKGFYTYQTLKNLPMLWFKNVPTPYLWRVGWRLAVVEALFFARAVTRGQFWTALKATCKVCYLICKKIPARRHIQHTKKVSDKYIWQLMVHDLPPNATALRAARAKWWKLRGKGTTT